LKLNKKRKTSPTIRIKEKTNLKKIASPRYMEARDPPVHETMLTYVEKSIEFPTYHLKQPSPASFRLSKFNYKYVGQQFLLTFEAKSG
jgi:hypothetical protein